LNAGIAGLKRVLRLEHAGDNSWKNARVTEPRWIYAPQKDDGKEEGAKHAGAPRPGIELRTPANKRFGTGQIRITRIRFLNEFGQESYVLRHGHPLDVLLCYRAADPALIGQPLIWTAGISGLDGLQVMALISSADARIFTVQLEGTLRLRLAKLLLANGRYHFSCGLFGEIDLSGFNPHFTTSPFIYDFLARTVEFVVEGLHPAESWVFRQPAEWHSVS
jgi:hypothetical protein